MPCGRRYEAPRCPPRLRRLVRQAVLSCDGTKMEFARCPARAWPLQRRRNPQFREKLEEYRLLAAKNFCQRFAGAKPARAVDLGKARALARSGRPFHLEQIADELRGIAIAFDRPGVDDLAAGLLERAERRNSPSAVKPVSSLEFAPGRGEQILAGIGKPLRDRPGACVLLGPERAAGMDEEDLGRPRPQPRYISSPALVCAAMANDLRTFLSSPLRRLYSQGQVQGRGIRNTRGNAKQSGG